MGTEQWDGIESRPDPPVDPGDLISLRDYVDDFLTYIYYKIYKYSDVHFKKMKESRDYTERMLSNPNPRIRWAALQILGLRWTTRQEFAEVCASFLEDDDDEIRALAIGVLASVFFGSYNYKYIKIFLLITLDDKHSLKIRRLAYYGFLDIIGEPYAQRPRINRLFVEESIDYTKVSSYLID